MDDEKKVVRGGDPNTHTTAQPRKQGNGDDGLPDDIEKKGE